MLGPGVNKGGSLGAPHRVRAVRTPANTGTLVPHITIRLLTSDRQRSTKRITRRRARGRRSREPMRNATWCRPPGRGWSEGQARTSSWPAPQACVKAPAFKFWVLCRPLRLMTSLGQNLPPVRHCPGYSSAGGRRDIAFDARRMAETAAHRVDHVFPPCRCVRGPYPCASAARMGARS